VVSKEPAGTRRGERKEGGREEGTYQEFFTSIARGPSPADASMGSKHTAVHAGGVIVNGDGGGGRGEGKEGAAAGEGGGGSGGGGNRAEGGREGGREGWVRRTVQSLNV